MRAQLATMLPQLVRFANQRLGNRSLAEDAAQDAVLAVLEHPERYVGRSSLRTYVTGILKFKIADTQRRNAREWPAVPCARPPGEPAMAGELSEDGLGSCTAPQLRDPLGLLQEAQFLHVVSQGLDKLSGKARRAFVLRACEGLDTAEVCEELDVSPANAWVLHHRARSALQTHLTTHWSDALRR